MSVAIPERILNYRISATSPTDELLTLRHIYSEVGEYASTILDREHMALSKKCVTRLNRVEKQLSYRPSLLSAEEENFSVLSEMKGSKAIPVDGMGGGVASMATITREIASTKMLDSEALSAMTVDELYNLYRGWPLRHREREAEGREHMTFYFEGKIVGELQRREVADKGEQLKIDYCAIIYRNELENLAFIFSLPIPSQPVSSLSTEVVKESTYPKSQENIDYRETGKDYIYEDINYRERDNAYIYPESDMEYSLSELLALIKLYSHYRTITERELLTEYVDMALNLMLVTTIPTDKIPYMALASELVEIGRKGIIRVPGWVSEFLDEAIEEARKVESVRESELVLPLLTLHLQNGSPKLEREAIRIVNRCYRSALALEGDIATLVDDLYTAVTCCDYVSRFNVKKVGKSWNDLATRLIASTSALVITKTELHSSTGAVDTAILICLLKIASEIEDYTQISVEQKATLTEMLERCVALNDIEAQAYLKSIPTPMAQAV